MSEPLKILSTDVFLKSMKTQSFRMNEERVQKVVLQTKYTYMHKCINI